MKKKKAVRWGDSFDSIIIEDIRKFTKILPSYFETKNYTSFVRQLSYYNFQKVKSEEGINEFKLEGFKLGNLKYIRSIRKKDKEDKTKLKEAKDNLDELSNKCKELELLFKDSKSDLKEALKQNEDLKQINKDLVIRVSERQGQHQKRLKKIMFCLYMAVFHLDEETSKQIIKLISESKVNEIKETDHQNCFIMCMRMNPIVKQLTNHFIYAEEQNEQLLSKLVELFSNLLNQRFKKKKVINWEIIGTDLLNKQQFPSLINQHQNQFKKDMFELIIPKVIRKHDKGKETVKDEANNGDFSSTRSMPKNNVKYGVKQRKRNTSFMQRQPKDISTKSEKLNSKAPFISDNEEQGRERT